jgi:hypothetical protein
MTRRPPDWAPVFAVGGRSAGDRYVVKQVGGLRALTPRTENVREPSCSARRFLKTRLGWTEWLTLVPARRSGGSPPHPLRTCVVAMRARSDGLFGSGRQLALPIPSSRSWDGCLRGVTLLAYRVDRHRWAISRGGLPAADLRSSGHWPLQRRNRFLGRGMAVCAALYSWGSGWTGIGVRFRGATPAAADLQPSRHSPLQRCSPCTTTPSAHGRRSPDTASKTGRLQTVGRALIPNHKSWRE